MYLKQKQDCVEAWHRFFASVAHKSTCKLLQKRHRSAKKKRKVHTEIHQSLVLGNVAAVGGTARTPKPWIVAKVPKAFFQAFPRAICLVRQTPQKVINLLSSVFDAKDTAQPNSLCSHLVYAFRHQRSFIAYCSRLLKRRPAGSYISKSTFVVSTFRQFQHCLETECFLESMVSLTHALFRDSWEVLDPTYVW